MKKTFFVPLVVVVAGLSLLLAGSGIAAPAKTKDSRFSDIPGITSPEPAPAPAPSVPPAVIVNPPAASPATAASPSAVTSPAPLPAGTNEAGSQPSNLNTYVPDDKYRLRVGDRIAFQIIEDKDAPKSLTIVDSGELDIPYIGRITATDKTCKQLSDECKKLLEKEYYYRATVIVALDAVNRFVGRIYIWGQVKTQGPIDLALNENLTVGKAILKAGGFGDFANKKHVKVIRAGLQHGGTKQVFELNMAEILEGGKTEKDVVLQPDDSVIIPTRLINF